MSSTLVHMNSYTRNTVEAIRKSYDLGDLTAHECTVLVEWVEHQYREQLPQMTTCAGPCISRQDVRDHLDKMRRAKGRRGWHTCEECGGKTRSVLDGEAWCDKCGRYQ